VPDVACGSGGPALFAAQTLGCSVTGIDIDEQGIAGANRTAAACGLMTGTQFLRADSNSELESETNSFDAIICIDAANHFENRREAYPEWAPSSFGRGV
jgi:cyclopropane fatty-acyl-phospholipid synthase-like methyltransferase